MRTAQEIIRASQVTQAPNGICYGTAGEVTLPSNELERMIASVPRAVAAALQRNAFYFVPLAIADEDKTLVAERFDGAPPEGAICHRNIDSGNAQCVFISTRLLEDRFSIAFEFYINVGHAFVDKAGMSPEFAELVWSQAAASVRGETSRSRRSRVGSSLLNALSMARSSHVSVGRGLVRRSTATSCRSTRISTSLAASERASSAIQLSTRASTR